MSHFRVAVFSNSPSDISFDELLAPYDENLDAEFMELTDDEIENLRKEYEDNKYPGDFEEFLTNRGYINDPESGMLGYYFNPSAKWDWYSLDGGDWQFDLKEDEEYDDNGCARKNQFSYFDSDYSESKCTKRWKELAELAASTTNSVSEESDPDVRLAKIFMSDYPTLEHYLRCMKLNYPYAFITPNGEWHAPGRVGWFGLSDDTAESMKQYLDEWEAWINSDVNPYVNFVDCHI